MVNGLIAMLRERGASTIEREAGGCQVSESNQPSSIHS
jgi:hypothetical protein